jgi:hypothetical protein
MPTSSIFAQTIGTILIDITLGLGFAVKLVSFTPGFSPVERHFNSSETVLTVSTAKAGKPLETVSINASRLSPG